MKKCKIKLREAATLSSFALAAYRAEAGKRSRRDVEKYNENFLGNTTRIWQIVRSGNYWPSPYHEFYVYDPKLRLVQALPFADRVVHQWLVEEVLKPYFFPRFIKDTYACIPGRGTHAAVYAVQKQIYAGTRRWYRQKEVARTNGTIKVRASRAYVLKMDISKFFPSVDRDVLFDIIKQRFVDPELIELIRRIIYDPGVLSGIPIGNYTSQLFANIYLNELDHYCKDVLRLPYYVRYMDDFIIVVPDKDEARRIFVLIQRFVEKRLNLRLNPKSHIMPASRGVDFCGYVIYPRELRLRTRSKNHLRKIERDFENGIDNAERHDRRVRSWLGHARHADKEDRYAKHVLKNFR